MPQLTVVIVPAGIQLPILCNQGKTLAPVGRGYLCYLLVLKRLYLLWLRYPIMCVKHKLLRPIVPMSELATTIKANSEDLSSFGKDCDMLVASCDL
jgi:hypothetical protein